MTSLPVQVFWLTPVVPAVWRLKQVDLEFEARINYILYNKINKDIQNPVLGHLIKFLYTYLYF